MKTIIKFKFIYLLKLQCFSQLQEQHEATKIQASKTKHTEIIIIKIQKKNLIPVIIKSKWNHLKAIQKIQQKHNWKARNQGTTENSQTGQRAHTGGSTVVKVQKVYHVKEDYIAHTMQQWHNTNISHLELILRLS